MAKRGIQGAVLRGLGARDHIATVLSKEHITGKFVRIHLNSPTLFTQAVAAPTAWARVWFPDPNGSETEYQRAYTYSESDAARGDFALDFVLHEPAGPASAWAQSVSPGDTISVMSMGSSKFDLPETLPAGFLLVGDSASIPAICGILETIPDEIPIELYLEQHDETEREIPLPSHPGLAIHWVPREGAESLAAAIEARDWSEWKAWVACESSSLKAIRARLRKEFALPKPSIYAQAYWVTQKPMGTSRDSAG